MKPKKQTLEAVGAFIVKEPLLNLNPGDANVCEHSDDDDDVLPPVFRPLWVRAGPADCQFLDQILPLESAATPWEMGEWLKVSPSHPVSQLKLLA